MKLIKTIILLFVVHLSLAQNNLCRTDILNGLHINSKNLIKQFTDYNFSDIWLHTEEENTYGIIGKEHQRMEIKLISIQKNRLQPNEYLVYGKSRVRNNICDFVGKITLTNIQKITSANYGVDNMYENTGIKMQGLLTAKYDFFENEHTPHSGHFSGTLKSLFYIGKDNAVKYNDINMHADAYFNNAFTGKWKSYYLDSEKTANWGDYRVPNVHCDFDIGVGDFSVSEKYVNNGWLDIILKNKMKNAGISEKNNDSPSKDWWK